MTYYTPIEQYACRIPRSRESGH